MHLRDEIVTMFEEAAEVRPAIRFIKRCHDERPSKDGLRFIGGHRSSEAFGFEFLDPERDFVVKMHVETSSLRDVRFRLSASPKVVEIDDEVFGFPGAVLVEPFVLDTRIWRPQPRTSRKRLLEAFDWAETLDDKCLMAIAAGTMVRERPDRWGEMKPALANALQMAKTSALMDAISAFLPPERTEFH